jgi:hypothetical protein
LEFVHSNLLHKLRVKEFLLEGVLGGLSKFF